MPPIGAIKKGLEVFTPKKLLSEFELSIFLNTRGIIPINLKILLFLDVVKPYSADPFNHFFNFGSVFFIVDFNNFSNCS